MSFGIRLPLKFKIGTEAESGEVVSCRISEIEFGHVRSSKRISEDIAER